MTPEMQASVDAVLQEQARVKAECARLLDEGELLDEDGYPTDSVLWMLEHWAFDDPLGWLRLAKSVWHHGDLTWHCKSVEHDFRRGQVVQQVHVSAFGWSGNESLIRAMEANWMLWSQLWYQSNRGGHYIFEIELGQEI